MRPYQDTVAARRVTVVTGPRQSGRRPWFKASSEAGPARDHPTDHHLAGLVPEPHPPRQAAPENLRDRSRTSPAVAIVEADYPVGRLARERHRRLQARAGSRYGISARTRRWRGSGRVRRWPIAVVRRWCGRSTPATRRCSGFRGTARAAASRWCRPRRSRTGSGSSARGDASRVQAAGFRPHEVGGCWVSDEQVDAVEQVVIGDLIGRHAAAHQDELS